MPSQMGVLKAASSIGFQTLFSDILEHHDKRCEYMQSHCNAGIRKESIQNWQVLQWEVILML